MTKLPLYHETARDGRGGIPGWWFGAPVIAFAYAFVAFVGFPLRKSKTELSQGPQALTISICELDSTRTLRAGTSPMRTRRDSVTVLPGSKPSPRMVMTVPPVMGPHEGTSDSNAMGA